MTKFCIYKAFIEQEISKTKLHYEKEYMPIKGRKFRFDFYINSLNLAIEYEGIMSAKARHTSVTGYTKDCEKYNLCTINGYRVLRYTVLNYKQITEDLNKIINDKNLDT